MIAVLAAFAADPSVLDDPAFRFCHRPLEEDFDRAFCDLLDDLPPERCPGLRERCSGSAEPWRSGCNDQPSPTPGSPGSTPSAPDDAGETPIVELGRACQAGTGVGTVLAWIVAMAVAALLAGIAIAVLRAVGLRADTPPPPAARPLEEDDGQTFAEAVDDVPDLPSEDLLAAARRALADARYGEASLLARGAVLRRLGERRVLKLHRARTDREYVGMAEEPVRTDLHAVLAAAERHRWGRVPLDLPALQDALAAAGRLVALGALLALAPSAWGADRFGVAGDLGLRRVLERHGHQVAFRSTALAELTPGDPVDLLVVDGTGLTPTDADRDALRAWVEAGGVLFVAGLSTDGFPELGERVSIEQEPVLVDPLRAEGLSTPRWPDGAGWGFTGGTAWTTPSPAALAGAEIGDGYVLALGDGVLLWNGALVHPANEAFLGEIPYRLQARGYLAHEPIRVELATLAGQDGDDPASAPVANLRLLPFVVQVLVLWVALVAWRGWPFTRLSDPPERGRLRFVDHLDAVARHYRADRATGHILRAMADWALETRGRAGLILAARRHGRADAEAFVARMEAAVAAENPENRASDLDDLEELWKLTRPR